MRAIALVLSGMILIHEVADATVIMDVSKPADLKSQHSGDEGCESTISGCKITAAVLK